jgi:DNA (cytosine-5)-methyltransferase 1
MRIGSLFSGVGGLDAGLEMAGVGETVWQVEQSAWCRGILAQHWPEAQRFDDVCTVGAHNLSPVDVLCGGFPCQDVSLAGKRGGIVEGTRSGLWFEFHRIITELRPTFVIVENTRGLETLGLQTVLTGLRTLGYRGERYRLSACAVGAPHARPRVFVLAYAHGEQLGRDRITRDYSSPDSGRHPVGAGRAMAGQREQWAQEPRVDRVANGVPDRMERNKALGNAVVPHVAAIVGRRLLDIADRA